MALWLILQGRVPKGKANRFSRRQTETRQEAKNLRLDHLTGAIGRVGMNPGFLKGNQEGWVIRVIPFLLPCLSHQEKPPTPSQALRPLASGTALQLAPSDGASRCSDGASRCLTWRGGEGGSQILWMDGIHQLGTPRMMISL